MKTETHEGFNFGSGALTPHDIGELGQKWKWILVTGIFYLVLGIVAFTIPVASTLGLTFGLGALLVIGGIVHFVHAVELRHRKGAAARFIQSLLAVVTGGLMLRYPGAGMLGLALLLTFYFFVGAGTQWILAMSLRPHEGWGWGMASAVISFILGAFILFNFPFSALWVPGTLLGIDMIVAGCGMVAFSLASRKAASLRSPISEGSSTLHPSTV